MYCESSKILFEPIKIEFTDVYIRNNIYKINDGKEYRLDKNINSHLHRIGPIPGKSKQTNKVSAYFFECAILLHWKHNEKKHR